MKDLKHFITKKNRKYRRNTKLNIDYANPTDVELLAYCVFNNFKKLENYAENFERYMDAEEYLCLIFHSFGYNQFYDYDMPETFVRDVILDSLLPNYKFDDVEVYFDSYWDNENEEYWEENIELIYDFLDKYKIPKRYYKKFLKDFEALDFSSIYMYIIKSRYLVSIYHDRELRGLFESAVYGDFISPSKFVYFEQIFHDGYGDEPHIDKIALIKFVEVYKKKFNKKREYKFNYEYAAQLLEINECPGQSYSLINYFLDNFETKTEVMF